MQDKSFSRSYTEVVKSKEDTRIQTKLKISKVNQSSHSFWIKKEKEILDLNFSSLLVTRLMEFYSWPNIKPTLEDFFQTYILINPFFVDKALIEINKEIDPKCLDCKWKQYGRLHLKIEH